MNHTTIFIRDLELNAYIGIHAKERKTSQPIWVNLHLEVLQPPRPQKLSEVVCYEQISKKLEALVSQRHIDFLETLADEMASLCLEDERVLAVKIRIEKPKALTSATACGVEIKRRRS